MLLRRLRPARVLTMSEVEEPPVSNVCRKCKRAIDDHNFLTEPKGCPK